MYNFHKKKEEKVEEKKPEIKPQPLQIEKEIKPEV